MTSKQKLDRFNARLEKKYKENPPTPNLLEKGRKYDPLKQRNDELVEALKDCLIDVVKRCTDLKLDCTKYSTYIKANKALKNNEND